MPHHDEWHRGVMAHTSPVYVAVGGTYRRFDPAVAESMLTLLQGMLEYIHEHSPRYPAHLVTHHHGEADHLAVLERPFRDAIAAIRQRLREGEAGAG